MRHSVVELSELFVEPLQLLLSSLHTGNVVEQYDDSAGLARRKRPRSNLEIDDQVIARSGAQERRVHGLRALVVV